MSQEKQRTKSLANIADYQTVFSSPTGKKVLWDLMKHSGMLYFSPSLDHGELAFREGKRDVVVHILNKLKVDTKKLEQLIEQGVEEDAEIWS